LVAESLPVGQPGERIVAGLGDRVVVEETLLLGDVVQRQDDA
jgi:hypothetical protein